MTDNNGWPVDEGSVALGVAVGLIRLQLDNNAISIDQAKEIINFAMPNKAGVNYGQIMDKVRSYLPELFGSSQAQRL